MRHTPKRNLGQLRPDKARETWEVAVARNNEVSMPMHRQIQLICKLTINSVISLSVFNIEQWGFRSSSFFSYGK